MYIYNRYTRPHSHRHISTCAERGFYMSEISRFDRYISNIMGKRIPLPEFDKEQSIASMTWYMFARTQSLFTWHGLPETIPQRNLELYLQINGSCAIYSRDGNLYAFTGGFGGELNVYYMPTIYTISNPALHFSVNAEIDKNCIIIPNDSAYQGLFPLHTRYARNMIETEVSIYLANINSRIISLISAQDDRTRKSAEKYLQDIVDGKIGIVGEQAFFDDLKTSPFSAKGQSVITDLIELMQYLKASWYNEIGLNANYNMKREAINSNESQMNNDALLPFIDDMKKCRETAIDKINNMFGTNISIEYNSAWEDNEIELEAEQDALKENDDSENGGENENESEIE